AATLSLGCGSYYWRNPLRSLRWIVCRCGLCHDKNKFAGWQFGHVAIDIGRGQAEVPFLGTDQLHAIVADRLVVAAHHEMQFVTGAGQHQPVEAADGTGTHHCNPHNPPPTGCWKPSETIRLDLYKC